MVALPVSTSGKHWFILLLGQEHGWDEKSPPPASAIGPGLRECKIFSGTSNKGLQHGQSAGDELEFAK